MPLFIISASMSKRDGMITASTILQGYRLMDTKEQAVGDFVLKGTDTRPGFSIDQVICMEVDPDHIAAAHAALQPA